jgi:hypothetical protein
MSDVNTNKPMPPAATADGPAGSEAMKLGFIAESGNEEFLLFREARGKTWVFPRAHLVSSRMKERIVCEFNFRTHLVTFGGNDCTRIYRPLLDTEVCAVVVADWPEPPPHVRTVVWLKVKENDTELKQGKQ